MFAGVGTYTPRAHAAEYGLLTNPDFNGNVLEFVSRELVKESLKTDGMDSI